MPRFTGTQRYILDVLADGNKHSKDELIKAIDPTGQASEQNLRDHISLLNKRLRPVGQEVVCISNGTRQTLYRHMRLINTGD